MVWYIRVVIDALLTMKPLLSGVFAALATPINEFGRPDLGTFIRMIDFVVERGIEGIVVGGGTAEYPHFDVDDRAALAACAVQRMTGRGQVIVSVGTSSIFSTLLLARKAIDSGCGALLLPMPHFFRYSQQDLIAYCETVCASLPAPWLLYNLPSFTNPIEVQTATHLLKTIPDMVGMKDSSGQTANLKPLADVRSERKVALFVGDDGLLLGALRAGWDGVISGIASFAPELIRAIYQTYRSGDETQASVHQAALEELIEKVVSGLPIPWGVRIGLEARGVANGAMHIPLSQVRRKEMEQVRASLAAWAAVRGLELDQVWKSIA